MRCIAAFSLVSLLCGCPDSGTMKPDRGSVVIKSDGFFVKNPDADPSLPDGYVLRQCAEPGKSCNPQDPCAINAICDHLYKCRPKSVMNCSDGLDCTKDTCKGAGMCVNTPQPGYCKLAVKAKAGQTCKSLKQGGSLADAGVSADAGTVDAGGDSDAGAGAKTILCCFTKGERNPNHNCQTCNPGSGGDGGVGTGYATSWSPATGGVCNDNDPCTKNDFCQNGTCKGTSSGQCSDGLPCTTDECDGKGGCLGHKILSDWCVIDGACHKKGSLHPSGQCSGCDPTQSQTQWSLLSNTCSIDNQCHAQGKQHPLGCAHCDTKTSKTAWTIKGGFCFMGNTCHKAGTKNPANSCSICQPKKNPKGWSPAIDICKINGKCQSKGDKHPAGCAVCEPAVSTTKWVITGPGKCFILNNCWSAGASDSTGCKSCQPGKDPYVWTPVGNKCMIGSQCLAPAAKHPQGCAQCDPMVSTTKWTVIGNTNCIISNNCLAAGTKDSIGCSSCNPAKDKYGWTALTDVCKIGGKCYAKGAKHPQGCAECDPAVSTTGWTAKSTTHCLIKDACLVQGSAHPSGCGGCDPSVNQSGWTVPTNQCLINDVCYAPSAKDPIGCNQCDPTKAKTSWTKIAGCFKIIFTTLDEAHKGDLGGVTGADALCAKQAKKSGWSGTFKAFLSDSTHDVKDLVKGAAANTPVVNTKGTVLYSSWNAIFTLSGWGQKNSVWSFNGTLVDEGKGSPGWIDADGWHGSNTNGTAKTGYTCNDWTASTAADGACGEIDEGVWISSVIRNCGSYLAVPCVQVGP